METFPPPPLVGFTREEWRAALERARISPEVANAIIETSFAKPSNGFLIEMELLAVLASLSASCEARARELLKPVPSKHLATFEAELAAWKKG
jgi:hypothetical protein